jgi:tetratricopeptide (TPR) repeat protein
VLSQCAVADALLRVGEKQEARKAYLTLLKRDPTTRCAIEGLTVINARSPTPAPVSCKAADRAFDSGNLEAARELYDRLGVEQECAASGLEEVRSVERLCGQGQAYLDVHRKDDALTAFRSALAKNPNAKCATDGVKKAKKTDPHRLASFIDGIFGWAPRLLEIAGFVALVFFAILLFAYFGFVKRYLAELPIIGRILSPRLMLGPLDDEALSNSKVGAPMAARIKERLNHFRNEALAGEAPDYELDFGLAGERFAELVSGNAGGLQNALGKVSDVSTHTALVAALIDLLYAALPIHRLKLSGVLDPAVANEASVTLSLEDGSRLGAAATLKGRRLGGEPTARDYLDLSQPVAVWVQYEVARIVSGDKVVEPGEAESYVLVREGIDRHLEGKEDEARTAFERALALHPQNWAALVNLAATEARLADDPDRAIAILADALDEIMESG